MMRVLLLMIALVAVGATLLLGEFRWFRRPRPADRIRPHLMGGGVSSSTTWLVISDWRTFIPPIMEHTGDRLARALGVDESLAVRLRRVHATSLPRQFRIRQMSWSIGLGALTLLGALALRIPASIALLLTGGAAALAFLLIEQQLAARSDAWQRRIRLELPIVCEQLGMLLSAGHSLGQALTRLARRDDTAVAIDLAIVVGRLQQGIDEITALREWADIARVPALDRLLTVLALNREATDLGSLITEESRAGREEVHRELLEQLERRAQQVWIPVTVATLVPGLLFLAVPFTEAIRLFTTT